MKDVKRYNSAVEQTAGSRSLAAAAHRERSAVGDPCVVLQSIEDLAEVG